MSFMHTDFQKKRIYVIFFHAEESSGNITKFPKYRENSSA